MDNLCHSLAGAVIAQAGFARRVPRATLLCVIGANIPDVDASAYVWGDSLTALTFRRGWTHGLPALVLWSLLLAAVFRWWDRRRPRATAARADEVGFQVVLAAAALAVFSHTSLDWLNNYGVRWLMPFSPRWFYGDAIFIVDLVLLACFGVGWWFSRRRLGAGAPNAHAPARWGIAMALVYIASMKGVTSWERRELIGALGLPPSVGPRDVMVTPGPLSVLSRDALVRTGQSYEWYELRAGHAAGALRPVASVARVDSAPEVRKAQSTREWGKFARWTRFPYFVVAPGGDSSQLFVGDVRYTSGTTDSFASLRIPLPR